MLPLEPDSGIRGHMRFLALLAAAVIPTAIQAQQMVTPLGIPMKRMGSGTTWIPDATPLPSREGMAGSWFLMVHGFGFVQYDAQGSSRGDEQFGSLNWGMLMASRDLAGGRFQVRTMLSFDAATVSNRGYPLLLQSGESYRGQPLHDRQHPHDFWMELAVMYERAVSSKLGLALYAAPSGARRWMRSYSRFVWRAWSSTIASFVLHQSSRGTCEVAMRRT